MKALRTALRILIPLVIVLLGFVVAIALIAMRPEIESELFEPPAPLVEVQATRPSRLELSVLAQGTVVPRTESRIAAEVSGRVIAVSPSLVAGGFFEEEEELLRLDASDYESAVEDARMAVARAELVLAQEEADAAVARREWERLGRGEGSPLVLREPQQAEVRASLAAAQKKLDKAERDVERCVIRAPYAGRVRSKRVDVGQFASQGAELAQVYAVDYAEVRLPLPDAELEFLDLSLSYRGEANGTTLDGPPVSLSTRFAGRDVQWSGRIVRTEGELDPKSRMVVAVARVEDPYGRGEEDRPPLAVGMFVDAEITGKVVTDAFSLPRGALRGEGLVYLVDAEDRLRFREVEVLRTERDRAIISAGLAEGDRVVVSPIETAVDGMSVRARAAE